MIIEWQELFADYFGVKLAPSTAARWFDELKMWCRGITPEELLETIRWASRRESDRFKGKPALKELRVWVYTRRKEQRSGDEHEFEDCKLCSNGWLPLADKNGNELATPCLCPQGIDHMNKRFPDVNVDGLRQDARRAVSQAKTQIEKDKHWEQKWVEAGKPNIAEIMKNIVKAFPDAEDQSAKRRIAAAI